MDTESYRRVKRSALDNLMKGGSFIDELAAEIALDISAGGDKIKPSRLSLPVKFRERYGYYDDSDTNS